LGSHVWRRRETSRSPTITNSCMLLDPANTCTPSQLLAKRDVFLALLVSSFFLSLESPPALQSRNTLTPSQVCPRAHRKHEVLHKKPVDGVVLACAMGGRAVVGMYALVRVRATSVFLRSRSANLRPASIPRATCHTTTSLPHKRVTPQNTHALLCRVAPHPPPTLA
jgi:hypothetical protein